jgi:hypothetical protein
MALMGQSQELGALAAADVEDPLRRGGQVGGQLGG